MHGVWYVRKKYFVYYTAVICDLSRLKSYTNYTQSYTTMPCICIHIQYTVPVVLCVIYVQVIVCNKCTICLRYGTTPYACQHTQRVSVFGVLKRNYLGTNMVHHFATPLHVHILSIIYYIRHAMYMLYTLCITLFCAFKVCLHHLTNCLKNRNFLFQNHTQCKCPKNSFVKKLAFL